MIDHFCLVGKDVTLGDGHLIRSHTVIYSGTVIGESFTTGHGVLIREGCIIGNYVSIGSHSVLEYQVAVGNRVRIHSNVFIPEFTILEDDCWVGPCVVFTNSKHPNTATSKGERAGVTVKSHAVIGAGAVILPGVTIGEHAIVGAGAVVVSDVEAHSTVVGNPARVINEP